MIRAPVWELERNFEMSDLMAGKVVVVTGGAAGIGRATA
jgi:hypothetical protein